MGEEAGGISPQHCPLSPLLRRPAAVPRLRADKEGEFCTSLFRYLIKYLNIKGIEKGEGNMTEKLAELFSISPDLAAVIAPLFVIQMVLVCIVILDMVRNWKERRQRLLWILIALLITPIGPVLYLLLGRRSPHDTSI
ncbi:PLDc N-terminal domain-containing protein [Paenibacillus mesotrionivorans]|uniref:PLDc N-terminal domain-containing protein n=1 Tax=Paenibacillus mesotrionivorans TaxID=3160968 RepID=A0ACC7NSF3_9BACL